MCKQNKQSGLTYAHSQWLKKHECRISLGAVACANIVYCLEENILDLGSARRRAQVSREIFYDLFYLKSKIFKTNIKINAESSIRTH